MRYHFTATGNGKDANFLARMWDSENHSPSILPLSHKHLNETLAAHVPTEMHTRLSTATSLLRVKNWKQQKVLH